jgi:hypothetical protein
MISSVPSSANGKRASAVWRAISFCSAEVPEMFSGCVAFPPIAMINRFGILKAELSLRFGILWLGIVWFGLLQVWFRGAARNGVVAA